jgi:hypothetical protein
VGIRLISEVGVKSENYVKNKGKYIEKNDEKLS